MKTPAQYFADWEGDTFGCGYGTGEPHTITALSGFMSVCPEKGNYDYADLERALSPATAWLLINALCKARIIEYGTSPRYGWLTPAGVALKDFMSTQTLPQLIEAACGHDDPCYPDVCNCGPDGAGPEWRCDNPFWRHK